jgi:hypothetical protein
MGLHKQPNFAGIIAQTLKNWNKKINLFLHLQILNTLLYICSVLQWFAHYFQITMTTLYASPISFTFIARFTCSNGFVCCVCDKVNGSDKAGSDGEL